MLKFREDVVVGSFKVERNITEYDIETVIVNALEGGSNYWVGVDNTTPEWSNRPKEIPISTWVAKLLIDGETVTLYDIEDETEFKLTLGKLIKGFELNAKHRPFDSDLENGDGITADCILQYALFNEIVYG